ncbi:NfeD family protein [Angustibacter sp. McL0619]|uniref:NfeD family protein n=1 Tax=Angustibacter sp. McL0619 TaxID=3415676 RepID=UPI003CEE98F3
MDWLTEYPALSWVGLALLLGAIEVATLDLIFIMLALGALGAAVAAALGAGFAVQVIVFAVVAMLLLGVLRPMALRRLRAGDPILTGAAAMVGRHALVVETVTETGGRIKLHGEIWSARTKRKGPPEAILPGVDVTVLEIQGATAIVAAEEPESESPS